ncbi:hypothetical protein [Pelosinus propionicus]|uniref:Membrane domain of glycerophosphoryl diester phosphodiesterase n=1 Tax=Pelosinus propionicus DSM 13327 TaxID=1123291 RepID=A0A1I4KF09_9FIRM|nr:hypothetical protein [Pelosinus propionicus]SFL77201.1 hypothetical protein SAMN04490355_101725 [Pelosinus propionicus DSM 13327]
MLKAIQEREFNFSDVVSKGWLIYSQQFKAIVMITLIVYIPINIILYMVAGYMNSFRDFMNVIKILEGLFGVIAMMGIAVIADHAIQNNDNLPISWGAALNKAFSRWSSCLTTSILGGIIILGLTFLLIIPGVIWSIYYIFIIQIVALRELGGKTALNYSKSLVKGRWWKTFGIVFALALINGGIGFGIGYLSTSLPGSISIITDTLIDIIAAFYTVATTILFLNLDYVSVEPRTTEIMLDL